jgi:hypothetical protein
VRQQLKALLETVAAQQAESSASRQRSARDGGAPPSAHRQNPPPSWHRSHGDGAAASAVKQHLGPNRDARDTIEARRRAAIVENYDNDDNREHCDERHPHRQDNWKHGGCYNSDRDWSPD